MRFGGEFKSETFIWNDADELPFLDDGQAADLVVAHEIDRLARGRVRAGGDRIHAHPSGSCQYYRLVDCGIRQLARQGIQGIL